MTVQLTRRSGTAILAGLALVLTACGGDAGGAPAPASPTPSPTVPAEALGLVDWSVGPDAPVDLGDGWIAVACEGDAPLACLTLDGEQVGIVEQLGFPVADPPAGSGDVVAWLSERADDFAAALRDDRAQGCGPDYVVEFLDHEAVVLGTSPALRHHFTGAVADGTIVERGVAWTTVDGHTQTVLAANAYAPDGCVDAEGSSWSVDALGDAVATLDELARLTSPSLPGQTHGMVHGRIVAIEGRTVTFDTAELLTAAAAVRAAHADGALPPEEDSMPNDVYVRDRTADRLVLTLASDTTVTLVDCTAGCEPVTVDVEAWLAGDVEPYGGDQALYTLSISSGELVLVGEQYLP